MGKSSKKKKKSVKRAAEIANFSVPRSFVFNRGHVGATLSQLVVDIRRLMEPYTATNLKVTKSNVLNDFVHVAGPYGISHFIMVSKTDLSPYMKICRLPRGPTLTFQLSEYSLMKDVTAILKRPKTIGQQFKFPPLVVMNNFNTDAVEMKLMTSTFQNMFPAIKVHKVKLSEIRRCAMLNYDKETGTIDFRHYNIEAVPLGISRGVKKLLNNRIPNLGSLHDISDFVTGAAYLSESEGEEPTDSHVTLPQRVPGRGNVKSGQSAVRLTEMGPRMRLDLLKIEDGVCDGEVIYHKFVEKSEDELKKLKERKEIAKRLKEKRKKEQEANVAAKVKQREENNLQSVAGIKRKCEVEMEEEKEEDDDVEYYKEEVGEEPEANLLKKKSKRVSFDRTVTVKKFKSMKNKTIVTTRRTATRKIESKSKRKRKH